MNTLPFPTFFIISITQIIGLIGFNVFIYGLASPSDNRYIIMIASLIMMAIDLVQEINTRKK